MGVVRAAISEPWSTKATRRTRAEMKELREGLYELLSERNPQTVRQLFYAMVSAGQINKTEKDYKNVVVRLCGEMREADELPWEWITDETRWMRKPRSYSSLEQALKNTAETYRRDLWANQNTYVEIWCEKEALAGLFYEITSEYDVPLMIVKGFPSKDFLHGAAEVIEAEDKPAYVYYFGDWDPSGVKIGEDVEAKLIRYAPDALIHFQRVAITPEQIRQYRLPTRPTKREGNSHAKNFRGESVELDALPVEILHDMVRGIIESHIDQRQLEITKIAEKSEREALRLGHFGEHEATNEEYPWR
jgi:hypothetical protein